MGIPLLFTLEEKEVLLQNFFKEGLREFDRFKRKDLLKMYKLFDEVINYGK